MVRTLLRCAVLTAATTFQLNAATPTFTYEGARPLTSGGFALDFGNHAVPRLVDWDADGVLDLLVAAGDGYLWLLPQNASTNSTDFGTGVRVMANGTAIRAGTGYTSACYTDMNGDGFPDIVMAGNDNRVRCHTNIGSLDSPAFGTHYLIPSSSGTFVLPSVVGSRIEIADWDDDGLKDLFTGDYWGEITWYRNVGSASSPVFDSAGRKICRNGSKIHEPYNTHPRIIDFDNDGLLDIAYGINWGYVKVILNTEGAGTTNFTSSYTFSETNGASLNIRSLNGDDTTPDFADLNGDQVLDLISGGLNGKLFFMAGVPYSNNLMRIEEIMSAHTDNLGATLDSDDSMRSTLFHLHYDIRSMVTTLLPLADRVRIRDWYHSHIGRYPQYFKKQYLDQVQHAYVPYLAGQVWVNTFESMPDTPTQREETAAVCNFTGVHSNLLVDLGIIYVENSLSTEASQQALYDIAASIPAELQIVECVTQDQYLCPAAGKKAGISARKGVNLFAQVGDYTEGFPSDVPDVRVDGYSVLTAHELNHNVELAAGAHYPWFWSRKNKLLEQAAPPDIAFHDLDSNRFGIDWTATKARFLQQGYWDGDNGSWNNAYLAYWSTGAGAGHERHWLRDNLRFCLDAPQEAYATLANQYFTCSETMLQLAQERWKEGITSCLNQVLFFIDSYALDTDQSWFYRITTNAQVSRHAVKLHRNAQGFIDSITTTNQHCEFLLNSEGDVLDLRQTTTNEPMPLLQINQSVEGDMLISLKGSTRFRLLVEACNDLKSAQWTPWQTNNPFIQTAGWSNTLTSQQRQYYRLSRSWELPN